MGSPEDVEWAITLRAAAVQSDLSCVERTPDGYVHRRRDGSSYTLPLGWLAGAQGGTAVPLSSRGRWPVEIVYCRCPGVQHLPECPCDDGGPVAVPAPPPPVEQVEVAVLDTETTGLERDARVTEIAVVIVELPSGRIVRRSAQLVDPGCPIPPQVVRLTGITDAMVAGRPAIADLWPRIVAAVGDRPVVAHNAKFDRARLEHEVDRVAAALPPWRWWCSAAIARQVEPGRASYSLGPLAAALGVPKPVKAHRALADCLTTAALLERLARGKAWHVWAGEPAAVWAPRAWTTTRLEGVS